MLTTSTIELLSKLDASLAWESTGSLGTMYIDEVSEFYVKANLSTSSFDIRYTLDNGNLPTGLKLNIDGTIEGRATSTNPDTHTFSISAIDSTGYRFFDNEPFEITTILSTSTSFTRSFFKPLISLEKRKEYSNFITNKQIFLSDFIYRPYDSYFGVQRDLKVYLHFGIEEVDLSSYYSNIQTNFSRRKLKLGNLKTAIATKNDKVIYEIIYLEVIDDVVFNNTTTSFIFNGKTYYPPSIGNMRNKLSQATFVKTTEIFNPKFIKNIKPDNSEILSYIPFIPICYCLPEKSSIILKNIKNSGYKFNLINFEINKLFIEKHNFPQNKYLVFNTQH